MDSSALASKAAKYKVEPNFEIETLGNIFELSADGVTQLLERFHSLDTSGRVLGVSPLCAFIHGSHSLASAAISSRAAYNEG